MKGFKRVAVIVSIILVAGLTFGFTTSTVFTWIVRTTFLNYGSDYQVPIDITPAATLTLSNAGTVFTLNDTVAITRILPPTYPGSVLSTASRMVVLRCTLIDTLTDGVNLKLAGNFNMTPDDVITLIYNISGSDTFWTEINRSAN